MTRVAGIDCGTNSIRLLIAEGEPGSAELADIDRRMEVVRLGQGVDRTGAFATEALARTLGATRRYRDLCRRHEVERVRFVATSATRDAANRQIFIDGVTELLGTVPEVLSGQDEAGLSFTGAARVTSAGSGPTLVVDLGGGSTELVLGTGREVSAAWSMDVGCVRMTERHLATDPPTPAQVQAARADVDAALDEAGRHLDLASVRTVVGVAGSVTTVTAHVLGLPSYLPERIDGAVLPISAVRDACEDLLGRTRAQRAELGFMHPGRVDVIGGGALVWERVLSRVQQAARIADVTASEHDILDGIALSLL